jgi:hemolysin activation/secretion protein
MSCGRGTPGVCGRIAIALLFVAAVHIAAIVPSAAQTTAPSQVTPPTLRPAPQAPPGIALPGSAPLQVPPEAASLNVVIANVDLEGLFPEVADAVGQLVAQIRGRRVTVAELYKFAGAVEQLHGAAGYVLVRVVVPPQRLVDNGTFKLIIVDGYIEDIDVSRLPERVRAVIAARTAALIGRRHILLAEIERKLLIAGDVPGVRLKSTLVRGREQGGTQLVLEGPYQVVQGTVTTNNWLSREFGRWQHSAYASLNSAFGFGEQIYGSLSGSDTVERALEGTSPLKIFGAGAVIPLGYDGLFINPEYTLSLSRPVLVTPGSLATEDRFERFAARLGYPFIRTRAQNLSGLLSYEHIEQLSNAIDFDVLLYRDSYSVLRAGAEYGIVTTWGAPVSFSATLSQGLGGRSPDDAAASGVPLSREGAGPDFTKLLAEARYLQPLPGDLRLQFLVRGQSAFGSPLLKSEQFALDSPDTVSGFFTGTFPVDDGIAARVELSRPCDLSRDGWLKIVSPYVFGARGRGWLEEPTAVEQEMVTISSVGVGVRSNLEMPNGLLGGTVTFELARPFSDDPSKSEGYRGMVNAAIRF